MHNILLRQIKKYLDSKNIPKEFNGLFTAISSTYEGFDKDLELIQRSLEISSKELTEINLSLRVSEKRFQDVALSSGDWIWEVDKNGKYTFASGRVKEILGYSSEELIGKTPFDKMPKEEAMRIGEIFKKIVTEKKPIINLENWNLSKNKTKILLLTNGTPVLDEKGNLLGYRGIDKDITERKKVEEKIKESESKYRLLVENIPQKIFLKDSNSVYISCNESYAKDLKIKSEEITGKTDSDFFPKKLAEKYRADDKKLMEAGKVEDIEEEYIQDGKKVFVHTIKTPVKDEKDNVIGILGIFWNITEKKKAEEELKKRTEELERFNKIAVGRELKMIELKKKIKELEETVDKNKLKN